MTISQLLHRSARPGQPELANPETAHQVLPVLRRCLIWCAIVLIASWIISGHVFAEEITPVLERADVIDVPASGNTSRMIATTVVLRHARPERVFTHKNSGPVLERIPGGSIL